MTWRAPANDVGGGVSGAGGGVTGADGGGAGTVGDGALPLRPVRTLGAGAYGMLGRSR